MRDHELLIVRWIDARAARGTYTPDEFKRLKCIEVESVGWGYEFEDRVVLAADWYLPDNDGGEDYRDISVIPRECIRSIKRVVVGR